MVWFLPESRAQTQSSQHLGQTCATAGSHTSWNTGPSPPWMLHLPGALGELQKYLMKGSRNGLLTAAASHSLDSVYAVVLCNLRSAHWKMERHLPDHGTLSFLFRSRSAASWLWPPARGWVQGYWRYQHIQFLLPTWPHTQYLPPSSVLCPALSFLLWPESGTYP